MAESGPIQAQIGPGPAEHAQIWPKCGRDVPERWSQTDQGRLKPKVAPCHRQRRDSSESELCEADPRPNLGHPLSDFKSRLPECWASETSIPSLVSPLRPPASRPREMCTKSAGARRASRTKVARHARRIAPRPTSNPEGCSTKEGHKDILGATSGRRRQNIQRALAKCWPSVGPTRGADCGHHM